MGARIQGLRRQIHDLKHQASRRLLPLRYPVHEFQGYGPGLSLLHGVGPDGRGEFEPAVYQRFEALGRWLRANGEAIYDSHPVKPYQEGPIAYTAKGKTVYAIYLTGQDETRIPECKEIKADLKGKIQVMELSTSTVLKHKANGNSVRISLPGTLRTALAAGPAAAFKVTNED